LVKESATIIQNEKRVSEEKTGDSSENTSEEEEIDWDGVQVALDANKETDPKTFTRQKCGEANLRGSARIPNDNSKVLDKAKAVKKKHNEIPGTLSSFAVLNSVSPSALENLAATSSIRLGASSEGIAVVIDTMQAKELAKATLLAAKVRVSEQAKQKELKSGVIENTTVRSKEGASLGKSEIAQGQNMAQNLRGLRE
jgi:hypothetical protein